MRADWKKGWKSFVMGVVMLAVFAWLAYFWERSTGVTWASRRDIGQISTPAHLAGTRNKAIGLTLLAASLGAVYYLTRPKE